ncbi:YqgE/AlgH family protein [Shewanella sp.]|uniref:YqgE/AlgH family protein n=1 Tax=Shewanella sp. TaxID=50422 RepID=UPI003569F601
MDSLKNHLLIAMPSLNDGFFDRSVIYLCEHDAKGAMGLIINRPVGMSVRDLLAQLELLPDEGILLSEARDQVLVGGPVNPERGFVLHSTQSGWTNSSPLTDELMLTTSRDILSSLGTDKAPQDFVVALGYAGWSAGQLEQELADNSWLTIPASDDILFALPHEDRWQQASKALGFELWQVSSQTGHA